MSDDRALPRYPVYVISKGRFENPLTARFLARDGVPFRIVVEPQEEEAYAKAVGAENVLVLPFANLGLGSIPARNWVWEHSKAEGHERHWILDDNIGMVRRLYRRRRIPCAAGPAFAAIEDFADRYENVGIAGMAYQMFVTPGVSPYYLNVHVYSTLLIENALPYRWRGRYNEDTDLCLQVLSGGYCTVLFNAFMIDKKRTMTMKGGNTDVLYDGDGRLRMARSLERVWPHVVTTDRRWGRPQHVVRNSWKGFDTPLRRKPDVDLDALAAAGPNNYGLGLRAVAEIRAERLRELHAEYNLDAGSPAVGSDVEGTPADG